MSFLPSAAWIAAPLFVLGAFAAACSSSDTTGSTASTSSPGTGGAASTTSGSGGDTTSSSTGGSSALGGPFRYGSNSGHRNANWSNDKQALLQSRAGGNGQRILLPEWLFDQWGYDIEIKNNDFPSYEANGLTQNIAFVNGPIAAHSSAPPGLQQWELDHYPPKNLYAPVFLADHTINPENYWAAFMFKTVSQYKTWVKVWEVWNEPDWVSDYNVTLTWGAQPPTAAQLPRWNGSIFDYVRLLRVSREAAQAADPEARIATGGLGYPSFAEALLRYTDNPTDGSVTAEYPKKGGDYFDVLSFHYYPLYTPGNSDAAATGFIAERDAMAKVLSDAGVTGKAFTATETGAPHIDIKGAPSGAAYARSYLLKMMIEAQAKGMIGVDWFILSDGDNLTDAYSNMGLYEDVGNLASPDDAKQTETGVAYATLGGLMRGARFDESATKALSLPAGAQGAAFQLASGERAAVLWATATSGETASAAVTIPASGEVVAHAWDWSRTKATTKIAPVGGQATLALTSSPQIFVIP